MPREGTRSQTGNAKPRVFPIVDTAPAVKRTTKAKVAAPKPAAKAAKPTGVTKKKAAPKKESGVVKKVCAPTQSPCDQGKIPSAPSTQHPLPLSRGFLLTRPPLGQGCGEED